MDLLQLLLLFAGGCVAGFLAGYFGVGGGIVLVPILLYYYQSVGVSSLVATHLAFGTSLFIIVFTSSVSAREYHRNGHVVWRAVLVIGLASVVGALGGAALASVLQGKTLQRIFGAVVLIRLYGSMELAPIVGLADAIVDLVSTGRTLQENDLVAVEEIMQVSARLIVNQAALKTKRALLQPLIDAFALAVQGRGR